MLGALRWHGFPSGAKLINQIPSPISLLALWPQASNTEPPFEPPFPYLQIVGNDS